MEKLDQLKQITGNDKVPIEDIYKELYRSSIGLCSSDVYLKKQSEGVRFC